MMEAGISKTGQALCITIALLCGCAKTGPDNFEVTESTIREGFETGRILYNAEPARPSEETSAVSAGDSAADAARAD